MGIEEKKQISTGAAFIDTQKKCDSVCSSVKVTCKRVDAFQ